MKLENSTNLISNLLICNALYKSIFRCGPIVRGGCSENVIRSLVTQQNLAVTMCLRENVLIGSSVSNYKESGVLPVRLLYRQFSILCSSEIISFAKINEREPTSKWSIQKKCWKTFFGLSGSN